MTAFTLSPFITKSGLSAAINADGDGVMLRVTHIALGDGGEGGYTPDASAVALRGEQERMAISYSTPEEAGFRIRGVAPSGGPSYWVRELGIFLEDGTLLAVWSDPDRPFTGRGPGAELEFDVLIRFDALPGGVVEIVHTPLSDVFDAAQAQLEANATSLSELDVRTDAIETDLPELTAQIGAVEVGVSDLAARTDLVEADLSAIEDQTDAGATASLTLALANQAFSLRLATDRLQRKINAVTERASATEAELLELRRMVAQLSS